MAYNEEFDLHARHLFFFFTPEAINYDQFNPKRFQTIKDGLLLFHHCTIYCMYQLN